MARDFNQNRIANAILISKTIDFFGKRWAIQDGADGYSIVNVEVEKTPSDIKDYLEGDTTVTVYPVASNVTKLCAYALNSFPNIETIYLFSTTLVNIADSLSYLTELTKIYVPTNLISDYQLAYPTLSSKFDSIVDQYEFTIPYIGVETLTNDYLDEVIAMLSSAEISSITKVIIPVDFVIYESGVFTKIQNTFSSLEILRTTYEAGVLDINFQDTMWQDVLTKISAQDKTLDSCLVTARAYSRTISSTNIVNYTDNANLLIVPPKNGYGASGWVSGYFGSNSYVVYIANQIFNDNNSYCVMWVEPNLLSAEFTFNVKLNNLSTFMNTAPKSLKISFEQGTDEAQTFCGAYGIRADNCSSLLLIGITSNIKFDPRTTQLTEQKWADFFNALGTPTNTLTITIPSADLAKLSPTTIAIATAKNWQVVSA